LKSRNLLDNAYVSLKWNSRPPESKTLWWWCYAVIILVKIRLITWGKIDNCISDEWWWCGCRWHPLHTYVLPLQFINTNLLEYNKFSFCVLLRMFNRCVPGSLFRKVVSTYWSPILSVD
jgi:hypothetical protein